MENANNKPKWEALAKDDDGIFYVIASHAGKDTPQIKDRSSLFQFKLEKDANGIYKIINQVKLEILSSMMMTEMVSKVQLKRV